MINKVLHYCWFGEGQLSDLELECMDSWNTYLGDYKLMRWDENSFSIDTHPYVRDAYNAKKYAFVSDYVRIWALYHYGGIYLDTDYKVLKSLNVFLDYDLFMGNENEEFIGTAIIGATKEHWLLKVWLDYYDSHPFKFGENTYNMIPNTMIITDIMMQYGYKRGKEYCSNDISVFERDIFFPSVICDQHPYGVHYFRGSWWSQKEKNRANNKLYRVVIRPVLISAKRFLKCFVGYENVYKLEILIKKLLK